MDPQRYLQKHIKGGSRIQEFPDINLGMVIIIPSYKEPRLMQTLDSLSQADKPSQSVEVLVVLNCAEHEQEQIQEMHLMQYYEIKKKFNQLDHWLKIIPLPPEVMDVRNAGVGMARKIGMDEAVLRFASLAKEGIMINLDADCLVAHDYLIQVERTFKEDNAVQALSIGFCHHSQSCNEMEIQAMLEYELHLRLYINWQKHFGYPFAYQTLGSCFAVRSAGYRSQGGMNKRKAGEDFYFLHKFSLIGKLKSLDIPLVFPSGRSSDRVPFGTGRAIGQQIQLSRFERGVLTYSPIAIGIYCQQVEILASAFKELKEEGKSWKLFIQNPKMRTFLEHRSFDGVLGSVLNNSGNAINFSKRLFQFFDPFLMMKFLHEWQTDGYPKISVMNSFYQFAAAKGYRHDLLKIETPKEALKWMQTWDYPTFKD